MASGPGKKIAAVVFLRVNAEEKKDLKVLAEQAGLPVSSWLRMKVRELIKEEFAKCGTTPSFMRISKKKPIP